VLPMQSSGAMTVSRHTYVGLGFITLATLMFQILLTRIFSVTMAYHFAFMAVSTAMFGLTLGAILVYLLPQFFREDRANRLLAWFALACAFSTVAGFAIYLQLPTNAVWDVSFHADAPFGALLDAVRYLGLTYLLISIPFTLSGVVVCIALTKAPLHVSRLYAADLLGAAIGCVALVVVLRIVDGPTAVVVVAAVAVAATQVPQVPPPDVSRCHGSK